MSYQDVKTEKPKSSYQNDKHWDDINAKKADAIAWQGAHSDASQIVAALINIGFIKIKSEDEVKALHQNWVHHFYDSRLMH